MFFPFRIENNFNSGMFLILGQSPSPLTGLFHLKAPLLQKKSFAYFCASCSDEFWDRLVTFHRKQIFYKFWLEFHGRYRWLQTNNSFITWSFPSWVHLPFRILLLLLPFVMSSTFLVGMIPREIMIPIKIPLSSCHFLINSDLQKSWFFNWPLFR